MKKFLTLTLLVLSFSICAVSFANDLKKEGSVVSIDTQKMEFTIKDLSNNEVVINVTPATEFEVKSVNTKDRDIPFTELKVGNWVKVDYEIQSGVMVADDVEVFLNGPK